MLKFSNAGTVDTVDLRIKLNSGTSVCVKAPVVNTEVHEVTFFDSLGDIYILIVSMYF